MVAETKERATNVHWNCIVITCSNSKFKDFIEKETNKLSKAELLPSHDFLLVVEDPQPTLPKKQNLSRGVGSGGATLNALLVVTERLSALANRTTIDSDVLQKNLILLIHFGRSSFHYAGGNAFFPINESLSWVPSSICSPKPPSLLENSIWMASYLASESTKGVWVTSLDFFFPYSSSVGVPKTSSLEGALICTLNANKLVENSNSHGFITSDNLGKIKDINYRKQISERDGENERIVSGTTFLSPTLAENIFSLYVLPPLDRCTYYGTDTGTEFVQVSLYFDLLLPLCSDIDKEKYLSGELSSNYAIGANYSTLIRQEGEVARQHIWNKLNNYSAFDFYIDESYSTYLSPDLSFSSTLEFVLSEFADKKEDLCTNSTVQNVKYFNSLFKGKLCCNDSCNLTLINCYFGPEVILKLNGDCLFSNFFIENNMSIKSGNRIIWQCWPHGSDSFIILCHGFDDYMTVDRRSKNFTMFNRTWPEISSYITLTPEDLWNSDSSCQTLSSAKLFAPSFSLNDQVKIIEILIGLNPSLEDETFSKEVIIKKWKCSTRFSFQDIFMKSNINDIPSDDIFMLVLKNFIKETKDNIMRPSLLPYFKYINAMSFERTWDLVIFFHEILINSFSTSSRLLANVADILGCLAGNQGGLRSGPAGNRNWIPSLKALQEGQYEKGIHMLSSVCMDFIKSKRPSDIVRASRHYERASHIMISKQVETSRYEVLELFNGKSKKKPVWKWVEATCPVRLDLAGGWTDTPPICYELGGAVVNVAIKVNGKRPIGAKARICETLSVTCTLIDSSEKEMKLVWEELEDFSDYDNPVSPGALIKACIVYSQFIMLQDESKTLKDQLQSSYGGGLELRVWSELAQGSGLGGSSILAGTILAALFTVMGYNPPSTRELIHATLGVEQLLTTGGGWQDQVGGLIGGIKLGVSFSKIPLVVNTFPIPLTEDLLTFLNHRLLLVYTGKVRLARNLLQTVLRNWYAGETRISSCFHNLRTLALKTAESVLNEDISLLGNCIDEYWSLKKSVASGCEPEKVQNFMNKIQPQLLGQSLAGAGGGGYLYGLTKNPKDTVNLNELLREFNEMKVDKAEVDVDGLIVSVDGKIVMKAGSDAQIFTHEISKSILAQFS